MVKNFLGCRRRNAAGDLVVKESRHVLIVVVVVMVKVQTLLLLVFT